MNELVDLNKITEYYHDCYQTDLRSANLLNFFGTKVKHQMLLDSFESLENTGNLFPVDSEWGETVYTHMLGYAKVESLYCGALFLKGKVKMLGKTQQVVAPVYLYPAEVILKHEIYSIVINRDKPVINPGILTIINQGAKGEAAINYDTLTDAMPKGKLDFAALLAIETFFQTNCPHLSIAQLTDHDASITIESLKSPIKKSDKCLLVRALGIGVTKKPRGSRGIMTELKELSGHRSFSPVIKALFTSSDTSKKKEPGQPVMLPVTLSENQLKIFNAVHQYPLSMVIGPPGTGKSYTIAALAVEYMAKGKTVLIASKNDQAVNVIAEKIAIDFEMPDIVSNASNRSFVRKFKKKLKELVFGMTHASISHHQIKMLAEKIERVKENINTLSHEARLITQKELDDSQTINDVESGILVPSPFARKMLSAFRMNNLKLSQKYFPLEHIQQNLLKERPLWAQLIEIESLGQEEKHLIRDYLQQQYHFRIKRALEYGRNNFKTFLGAISNSSSWQIKGDAFSQVDFTKILQAFPVWTVNSNEIYDVLPLKQELFDLVIIDEATQCDIASVLPLLQRGKQAVIVGDPKQLRHLSFLSTKQQRNLTTQYQLGGVDHQLLDYRNNSILDLAMHAIGNQSQIQFLDEHYRSMPDIIRFSNNKFYSDKLTVMRSTPANQQTQSVFHIPVDGKREGKGFNDGETQAILQEITAIIEKEALLEAKVCETIGILSPFREQVDYLLKAITTEFSGQQIARHRILVGTAFSFQGEERDIMFLSFALDDASHPSAYRFLNREDVFNVSITRARHTQKVYTSFDTKQLSFTNLLFDYVDSIASIPFKTIDNRQPENDRFLVEVKETLAELNITQIIENYMIAGVPVDLVLVNKHNQTLVIDLVGFPGQFRDIIPIEKWQLLERVGVQVFFLPYSRWHFEKSACVQALKTFIS